MAKLQVREDGWASFFCPGCGHEHWLRVKLSWDGGTHPEWVEHPIWNWNGDRELPSLNPSVRYANNEQCHAMIENGLIWFYQDSLHGLAGQVVELPDLKD